MHRNKLIYTLIALIFSSIVFTGNVALAVENNSTFYVNPSYIRVNRVHIGNFAKIDDHYYRGAQPDSNDIRLLAKMGVKTIINLRNADSDDEGLIRQKNLAESLGMNYISIPMRASTPPTFAQIAYFNKITDKSENLPVYVHCMQGKDRTGIMTAIYRVRKYGWNFNQAYSEMHKLGYHSFIYPKQKKFLASYINRYLFNTAGILSR